MEIDPEFMTEDYIYDTYDNILDDPDLDNDDLDEAVDDEEFKIKRGIDDATIMGLALSFAEEISEERTNRRRSKYDIDSNTDKENMRMASLLDIKCSSRIMTPFEQHIDDICKGRKRLFGRDE